MGVKDILKGNALNQLDGSFGPWLLFYEALSLQRKCRVRI